MIIVVKDKTMVHWRLSELTKTVISEFDRRSREIAPKYQALSFHVVFFPDLE
jgi:hypothetical protein